jgi:glycosyltransferase involved in cell wall biosynthesis
MTSKLPLSLCMIVRNEERLLAGCLESAAPYVSEMIVVDTGSSDGTIELATAFGAKIVQAEWQDDFAAARNKGIELASEPWVLVLDADERLDAASVAVWQALLAAEDCFGYYVRLCSWIDDTVHTRAFAGDSDKLAVGERSATGSDYYEGSYITDAVCRLFRNDRRIRFAGALHEEVATAVAALGETALRYAPLTIWHEGYRPAVMAERGKAKRNARILHAALARDPDDVVLRYAAGTEAFTYGRWEEVVRWLEPLAGQARADEGYESDLLLKLSHACRLAGDSQQAEHWARVGIEQRGYGDFPDLYEVLAAALLEQDQAEAALTALEHALRIGKASFYYSSSPGAGSWRTLCVAGYANERLYRWEQAAQSYRHALERQPDCWLAWDRLMLLAAVDDLFLRSLVAALEALLQPVNAAVLQRIGRELLERLADLGLERLNWDVGMRVDGSVAGGGTKGFWRGECGRGSWRGDSGGVSEERGSWGRGFEGASGEKGGVRGDFERTSGEEVEARGDFERASKGSAAPGANSARVSMERGESEGVVERLVNAVCGRADAMFWRGLLHAQRGHPRAALYLAALDRRAARRRSRFRGCVRKRRFNCA